nr:hypothetical protein [Tanacetum cinerariifolium]
MDLIACRTCGISRWNVDNKILKVYENIPAKNCWLMICIPYSRQGTDTDDASTKDNFNLCAVVLWIINDYPALGILCGCPYSGFKEKNVAESQVKTLLNVSGKTKDGVDVRLALAELGVKPELFAMQEKDKTILPPADYTLTNVEKYIFCEPLYNIRVPQGYCSNFFSLVDRELAISIESVSKTVRWISYGPRAIVNHRAGGVKRDTTLGYILVDLNNLGHKVDPFILYSQVRQVFYVKDQIKKLFIVFKTPPKNYKDTYDEVDEEFKLIVILDSSDDSNGPSIPRVPVYGPSVQGLLDNYSYDNIEDYLSDCYFPSTDKDDTIVQTGQDPIHECHSLNSKAKMRTHGRCADKLMNGKDYGKDNHHVFCICNVGQMPAPPNTNTDLVYERDGISKVPNFDHYYDNEIDNLFSLEEQHHELHESTQGRLAGDLGLTNNVLIPWVTKEESEVLGLLMIDNDLFTCDKPLGMIYNEYNRLSEMDDNLFTYKVKIPELSYYPSVEQQMYDLDNENLDVYERNVRFDKFNIQPQQAKFTQLDSGLTVLVFKQGDDPIDAINHMMSFLSIVVTSRYPTTNNQLKNSSNPRQQATINDGRVTLQPIHRRQISFATGITRTYTPGASGSNSRKQKIVICYNDKGNGHMSKQCTKPKSKQGDSSFKDKVLLVQAQANGQILHEEELSFLADLRIVEDALAEVENSDNTDNSMKNPGVQAAVQNSNSSTQQDPLILYLIDHLKTQVINCIKINLESKSVNDTLTAELERYKKQLKVLKEGKNVDLKSQDNVSDSCEQSVEIDYLKQTLSK